MTHPGLVQAMMSPGFYPHRPESVRLVQTHISYIFIAGPRVYKVKKAVDFGFLDFTTLDKRKHYCGEELRLNRRLAPEIYLDVVEVSVDSTGIIVLGKGVETVDYAVVMSALPEERMLKSLIAEKSFDPSILERVAVKLAEFHRKADTGGKIDENGCIDTVRRNQEENFEQTAKYIDLVIPRFQYEFIRDHIFDFMSRHKDLFLRRVEEHRIRDCHGDLHLEHICLENGIVIFDCIEFNERFRYGDVTTDVAFLTMDLDFNHYSDYGRTFVDAYVRHAGDREMKILLPFYKCYYAYVRGKVTAFRSEDQALSHEDRDEAAKTASKYFDLAFKYAARIERPTLLIIGGLMGTGKSVLARNLAQLTGAEVIRTDVLRKEMLSLQPTERRHEPFRKGIYAEEITAMTYDRAIKLAEEKLQEGGSVIIDASFSSKEHRMMAVEAAERIGVDYFVLECVCPDDVIRNRLDRRMFDTDEASDGRWEIYESQKRRFDPITEVSETRHIVIDTSACDQMETAGKTLRRLKIGPHL